MQRHAEWPRWLYRRDAKGKREGRIFASPDRVPAGWMDMDELNRKPEPTEEPKTEAEKLSDDIESLPKEKLIEIAEQAGVEFDKRWKAERIAAAINEAAAQS